MPLSLLAGGAGAVVAIDPAPGQLALAALKASAVAVLDREDAIRYLGFLPAQPGHRSRLHREVRTRLDPETRSFWDARPDLVRSGAIHAGRFERFVRAVMGVVRPVLGRRAIEGLFECASLAEQEEWFDRRLDGKRMVAIFALAFAPSVFRRRGIDARSLAHRDTARAPSQSSLRPSLASAPPRGGFAPSASPSAILAPGGEPPPDPPKACTLAQVYHERFRRMCTATPATTNHSLQTMLLGRVLGPEAVPAYLTREGFPAARAGRLILVRADLAGWLAAASPRSFGLAQLSNTPDWMSQSEFEHVLALLASRIGPPGRAVWRLLHADRPIPAGLAGRIDVDERLGQALERTDRFPFYRIVPATIVPLQNAECGMRILPSAIRIPKSAFERRIPPPGGPV
ncbi:MAG: DUF3419 family protein [Planctomycetes bacterium]|nr:DUF3419 family protein [Planctomycetota bacterium]